MHQLNKIIQNQFTTKQSKQTLIIHLYFKRLAIFLEFVNGVSAT